VNAIVDPAQFVYRPAVRKSVGLMIMLAGASGTGKTLSALRLARGLAGPEGVIAFCDTENDRALYYADRFQFSHLSMSEPFRPGKFEAAAIAAQQQQAAVFVCDSFSHEHVGPGGLLDFHEEELARMVERQRENAQRNNWNFNEIDARERLKAAAWIAPKGEHKHMLQRLWQLNTHIILCCQAEKKIALVQKTLENGRKGKTEWVDQGFQPICGPDIPYAMSLSFMLYVEQPGVPVVIKPLLDDLKPLVPLDRPIDEALGAKLAAWAGGVLPAGEATKTVAPSPAQPDSTAPPVSPAKDPQQGRQKREVPEAEIVAGAEALEAKFLGTADRAAHLALVDLKETRDRLAWLKKHRPELHRKVDAAMRASWARTDEKNPERNQVGMDV
jgi:hypothetical protein